MSAVACIAKVSAAPGKRAELAAALQLALDNVEQEPGTRYYILHEDRSNDDLLWLYELYEGAGRTSKRIRARRGTPSSVRRSARSSAGRPELTFVTPIGGKGL